MKNREKYRDEIVEAIKEDDAIDEKLCCFVQNNIIPRFVSEEDMKWGSCRGVNCHTCEKMFAFWLDEEYEVDWDNVPVDTLVRVRDLESEEWTLKYFKGIDEEAPESRFMAWDNGATSKTAYGNYTHWVRCELVEDEDNGCN